jgi:predicted secreted protein
MALDKVQGRDVGIAIQKTINAALVFALIGCLTDSTFDVDTETDEATCIASGQFKEFIGGQTGWSLGGTLNVRQATNDASGDGATDADDNVTAENLLDIQLSQNNEVQVRYRIGSKKGSAWYTGTGIITKSSFKGQLKGIATYAISIQGSGPLVKTLAPA